MEVLQPMRPAEQFFAARVYTPAEIARSLKVGEETIRREIKRGRLSAIKVGNQYRATAGDLIKWLGEARYVELFESEDALLGLLGAGGLEEEEATRLAGELVRRVRRERVQKPAEPAPAPDEVRQRRKRR